MSSFRKFFRQSKQQNKSTYSKLSLSVASMAAALGFFCPIQDVLAQNIVRDDNGATVTNGFVHDIFAGTIDGDNAINKFKNFELDQNHIANMYFHMQNDADREAKNLLNFVDNKVSINGTINAVQNNKVGGNLFFFFKDGLVVGKTGVINAGTFSAMPMRADIASDTIDIMRAKEYMNLDSSLLDLSGTIDIYGQINTANGIRLKAGRAVNIGGMDNNELVKAALRTGLIDFSDVVNIKDANGKVTTASGLSGSQLQATRLKNGDVVLGEMKAGGVELTAEATHANAYDSSFTPIAAGVTGNNVVKTEVNIGEGSTVQAYGDITLKATSTNGAGQEGLLYGDVNIDSFNVADLFGQIAKTEAFVTVGNDARLQAGFDVANNKYNVGEKYKGSVTAAASTQNFYIDGALKEPVNFISQKAGAALLKKMLGDDIKVSGSFVNLENESSVNIGKNSVLEAAGDVKLTSSNVIMSVAGATAEVSNIKANAAAAAEQQANKNGNAAQAASAEEDISLKETIGKISDFMSGAAFAYNSTDSKSTINIDEGAQLTAKTGNVVLASVIDGTNITASAVKDAVKKPGKDETAVAAKGVKLGLGISDLNDTATINVKKNAKLTAEQGAVAISSKVEDRMKLVAAAVNSNPNLDKEQIIAGEASTALGLSFVNNSSNINIEGEISAAKGISVSSETKTSLTMSVNNGVMYQQLPDGTDATAAGAADLKQEDAEKMVGEVAKTLDKTIDKAVDGAAANTGDGTKTVAATSDGAAANTANGAETKESAKALITLGASVGAVDSDLQSNVNISKTAKLKTAGGALSISSASKYDSSVGDLNLVVSGITSVSKPKDQKDNDKKNNVKSGAADSDKDAATSTAVNASMLIGLLNSDAKINIEDGSSEEHAELSAPVIKLNSDTATHWDRVNGTVENIKNEWNKVKKNLVTILGKDSAIASLEEALDALLGEPTDDHIERFIIAQDELMEKLNGSTVTAAVVLYKKNVSDVLGGVKAFLNATNYANFAVGSTVNDGTQSTDIGISGSLLVTDMQNNAKINVGKYANIEAKQGNLEMSAKNDSLTISMVGAVVPYDLGNLWTKAEMLSPVQKVENLWDKKVPKKLQSYLSNSWGSWKAGVIPQLNVSGTKYGIGGNINISNDKNSARIFVGKGARLAAGKQLNLTADGQDVNAALVFGGALNSKTGITGMGSYVYGGNDISVSVDDETKLTADELALRAHNEEYINSLVFGFTSASEQAVGAAVNIVDFHSKASATVEDNDDEDDTLEGTLIANGITVSAENTGVNNAAAIAGSSVSQKAGAAKDTHDKQGQVKVEDKKRLNGLSLSGAGSLAMVLGETETKAAIAASNGHKLKITGDGSKNLSISAEDSKYNGAYSGSAALQFLQLGTDKEKTAFDGSLSGSVAAVDNKNTVHAYLANAIVDNYGVVESRVLKAGTAVAAGVALGVQSVQQKDLSGQLVVSGSGVGTENDIYTELSNVNIKNAGLVKNIAQNKDVQVAGGLTVSAAKNSKVGLGGAVSVLNADNTLLAKIHGGSISAGSIENLAVAKTTQVSGAITVGVLSGLGTSVNANGALSVNVLNNDVQSVVEESDLTADYFAVRAYDGNLQERNSDGTTRTDTQGNAYLDDDSEDAYTPSLKTQGLNVDGKQALDNINSEVTNVNVDKSKLSTGSMGHDDKGNMTITSSGSDSAPYVEGEKFKTDGTGSLIISTAVAVSVDAGSEQSYANIGAANVDNVINNNFEAKLTGSKINKDSTKSGQEVSVDAASKTQVIGVAMGVEAGQKATVGGGGSVTVQTLSNNTTATVENTTGLTDKLNITAQNSGLLINVAGAGAGAAGQTVAAGLTVATNVLHNTTGAYARGVNFTANGSSGLHAAVTADNTSEDYGFAVGVQAVTNSAALLNGATAINKGTDNVEAIVDSYEENSKKTDNKFTNVGSLDVKANDKTVKTAVAGGVQVAVSTGKTNYAALGGAVAYNEIGDFTEDSKLAKNAQRLLAQVKNTEIAMKQGAADKAVRVAADSDATLVTIAGGVGVSIGGVVEGQGAAATALTNTQTEALLEDSSIRDVEQQTAVSVSARSESDIVTTADALNVTVPKGAFSLGLSTGVAVNRITSGNSAKIINTAAEKKQLQAGSLAVTAENEQEIINAGIAGSVGVAPSGSDVSVAVNISVNKITADNTAVISGMDVAAAQAALVQAKDKRSARNYTGSFAISGGATAAVGGSASFALNEIGGATLAQVSDSNIKAQGLTVAADSENQLQSVIANVAVAGSGAASGDLSGNVNVNSISGSTKALMNNSDYNKDDTAALSALQVTATDKADVLGIVGSLDVTGSPSVAVGIGAASDTALLSRTTMAQLLGQSTAKNTINASAVNVKANSRQNVDSWTVGLGVNIGIAGAGGINGAIGVVENTAATQADMENIIGTVDAVEVSAEHESDISRYALATSIGVGEFGAAIGVSVGVLHDDSKTVANLNNNSLWGSANKKQSVNLLAQNKTMLNSFVGTLTGELAIGLGLSGDGSDDNYTNYVVANAKGNTLGSADNVSAEFNAAAKNILDNGGDGSKYIGSQMGLATGGLGTGAVGVILNNVDTATYTNIEDNTIYAQKIDIKAQEDRKIKNAIYNNGLSLAGAGVSVILTDINTKAEGFSYDAGHGKTADVEIDSLISTLQDSLDEQAGYVNKKQANDALRLAGISSDDVTAKSSINAESAIEGKAPAGVHTVVNNSKLYAGDGINVSADATTNIEAVNEQAAASVATVNITVSKTNIKQNVGVTLQDSELAGYKENEKLTLPTISVGSTIDGKIVNDAYQGGIAGVQLSTAYAGSWLINNNLLDITGSTLSGGRLAISAKDSMENSVHTYGVSAGGFTGGALVATAISAGSNLLKLDGTKLVAAGTDGDISLLAERSNKVNATAQGGALAGGSANGVVATAVDGDDNGERDSDSTLIINNSVIEADGTIDAVAQKLLDVKAMTRALNVGVENGNGSQNKAVATGSAIISSTGGNSFTSGESVKLAARVDKREDAEHGLASDMESDNGAAIGVQVSVSDVIYDTAAEVQATQAAYKAKKLSLKAENNPDIYNRAKNVEVGALAASGTIEAETKVKAKARVNAYGMSDESRLDDAEIKSSTNTKETLNISGNGGGLLDISPVAAKSLNRLTTDTQTNIMGSWQLANLTATAMNKDNLKGDVYSLKVGGIFGYGGVKNYNVVNHEADLNIGDGTNATTITTSGNQLYNAANILEHNFKSDADAGGLIYASLGTVGTVYDGEGSRFAAKINMNKAQLTAAKPKGQSSAGTIQAQAYTQGSLKYENSITDGGFYSGVFNDSYHDFTYDNAITTAHTRLTTEGQKDITLSAWDDTDLVLDTYANSNGAVASAYAHTTLDLVRNNNIHLQGGTNILSNHDVRLYAGRDLLGNASQLDLTAMAEAYNHSFIAAGTSPQVYINTFKQNNQLVLDNTSSVQSVHDVYLDAVGGTMNLTKSAKRYTIWRGNTTTEPTPEERATAEERKNQVTVNGAVTAGIHSGLNLTIDGNAQFNETKDDKGNITKVDINADNVNVSTDAGQEWFDTSTVAKNDTVRFENPLLERYNEIYNSMAGYAPESDEYKSLKAELTAIVQDMQGLGFAKQDPANEGKVIILQYMEMPALNLPDIYVSGGNIFVTSDADTISGQGSGSLTAKGVKDLEITNKSNMNLIVNDVVVDEPGGKVQLNNGNVVRGTNFNGIVEADADNNSKPKISISSTGNTGTNDEKYSDTNILVLGKVKNISGDVLIKNNHSDINISGDAVISASSITIQADAGSVTQTSEGLVNVGSDPITRYQFNDSIAKKIQQHIANLISNKKLDELSLNSYDAYCDYLISHKKDIGLDDADVALIKQRHEEYKQILAGTLDDGRGIVAGNNIYITARNINIDGLMQSGYALYKAEFTNDMAQKMQELDKKYSGAALLDSDVLGNDLYLLNKGGAVYNTTTHRYDNEIRLYYNPSTQTILSDSVETSGGQIYLNGAISSTGAGRILAMNGAADVSIDLSKATAANERKLQLGQININKVDGVIGITDTGINLTTNVGTFPTYVEYRVDADNSALMNRYYIDDQGARNLFDSKSAEGDDGYYKPQQGTYLSWTGGVSGAQEIVTKSYEKNFVAWGLIEFGSTEELVKKIENDGGNITVSTTTKEAGDTLANGVYFGRNGTKRDYFVTGSKFDSGETIYGETKTELDYTSYMLGFGKAKYTWTETTQNSTTSTTTILADKAIDVGFMKDAKGTISIKNAGDIKLSGALRNASATDSNNQTIGIGSIELVSGAGAIHGAQAGVYTDKLLAQAQDNILLTQTSIGDTAQISLNSSKGDIVFNSRKGDLVFTGDAGVNGAAGAQNGRYLIKAAGKVMTTKVTTTKGEDGYADKLVGKRLLINADNGSVDVRVKTGQDLGSGEYRRDGLEIMAQGDIKVYHDEAGENLLIGKLSSAAGNVSVTTTGSIVDAIDANELSDADSKLERWQQMGLVSADDAADSKVKAAQAAQERAKESAEAPLWRLAAQKDDSAASYDKDSVGKLGTAVDAYKKAAAGLADAIKKYENALQEADTEAKQQAAQNAFNQAQQEYFANKNYTAAEKQAITNYAQAAYSDGYGWSANQLLYAIKQDVLMSEPGQTVVSDAANITGKNITLKADHGIGLDAEAVTIAKADMNKVENMQLLANAKAGDLTWNSDGSVTLRRQQPILLDVAAGGKVSLNGGNNIYLATINNSSLHLKGDVRTNGDLRLMSANGITADAATRLYGRNMTLYGGAGSVGSSDKLLQIGEITGVLDANTARVDSDGNTVGVYLEYLASRNSLTVQGITTGELVLKTAGDMAWASGVSKDTGYLDAQKISLQAVGSIGSAHRSVRILNNEAEVNAEASNIYLDAVEKTTGEQGSLTLKNIKAAELFSITSAGTIKEAQESSVTANVIYAKAAGDILLNNGTNDARKITLSSAGNIDLVTNAPTINSVNIRVEQYDRDTLAQSIRLVNAGAEGSSSGNTMTISGLKAQGDIKVVQEKSAALVVTDGVESESGDIWLESKKGLAVNGTPVKTKEGSIALLARGGNLETKANISAEKGYVALLSNGSIKDFGSQVTAESIAYIAKENIDFKQATKDNIKLDAEKSVSLISLDGSINIFKDIDLISKKNVLLHAKNNITVGELGDGSLGSIKAEGKVNLVAETGYIHNKKSISGTDIVLKAESGDINNNGELHGTSVELQAAGALDNTNAISVAGDITMKSGKTLTNSGALTTAEGNIKLTGGLDLVNDLVNDAALGAKVGDVLLEAQNELKSSGSIKAGKKTAMRAGEDLTNSGSVTAENITLDAGKDLTNSGSMTAGKDITLTANGALKNLNVNDANPVMQAGGDIALRANSIENSMMINNANRVTLSAAGSLKNSNFIGLTDRSTNRSTINEVLLTGNTIDNSGSISANKKVELQAQGLLKNNSHLDSYEGDILLTSAHDSVEVGKQLSAENGRINIQADKDIIMTAKVMEKTKQLNLTATKGKAEINIADATYKFIGAGEVNVKAGTDIINAANITTSTGDISFTAGGTITNSNELQAKQGDILFTAGGTITNSNELEAKQGDILFNAGGSISNISELTKADAGEVSFTAGGAIDNQSKVEAGKDVNFKAAAGINNAASITAQQDVFMRAGAELANTGALTATNGRVRLTAGGLLTNTAVVAAKGNIALTSIAGSITNGTDAGSAKLTSETGNILLTAAKELINNSELSAAGKVSLNAGKKVDNKNIITATNGEITLRSVDGAVLNNSKLHAEQGGVTLLSDYSDVTNSGDLLAGNGDVSMSAAKGNVTNNADITAQHGSITQVAAGKLENTAGTLQAGGDITLTGKEITNEAVLTAGGDVRLNAISKLTNKAKVEASAGKLELVSNTDSVENEGALTANSILISAAQNVTSKGALTAEDGSVDVRAASGTLELDGVIKASGDVTAIAKGNVKHTGGFINARYGDVLLQSNDGSIENKGSIVGQQITLDAWNDIADDNFGSKDENTENKYVLVAKDENGSLLIRSRNGGISVEHEAIFAAHGNLVLEAKNKISNSAGSLNAGGSLTMKSEAGVISNSGKLNAGKDVELNASGDVTNSAAIAAKGLATLVSSKGNVTSQNANSGIDTSITANSILISAAQNVTSKGALTAEDGSVDVKAVGGTLTLDGRIIATKDVTAIAKDNVKHTGGFINARYGDVLLRSDAGSIENKGSIVGQQITLDAWENIADANFGTKDESTGYVLVAKDEKGNLLIRSRNGGISVADEAIFAAHGNLVLEAKDTISNKIKSLNAGGSLTMKSEAGAIYSEGVLRANENVRLEDAGDITLKEDVIAVNGSVAIISREGNINAQQITGMDVYLETDKADKKIEVKRTNVANTLGIKGNNAYLYDNLDDETTGIWQTGDGDVLHLKLDTAAERPWDNLVLNFNKLNKKLHVDELWVKDMLLDVPTDELYIDRLQALGTAEITTNKMHSIVYGKPPLRSDVDSVYWNAPNTWMHLYFNGDGSTQHSDGVLLHLRDYRYVYNQRYTAENWLLYRTLADDALYRGDIGLVPLWERYNLLDYAEAEPAVQGEVTVEL